MVISQINIRKSLVWLAGLAVLLGVVLRLYHITGKDFVFYDEGYYLNWSRPLGEIFASHQLDDPEQLSKAVDAFTRRSLASGKTLWFLLVDSRFFWGGLEFWSFSRVLAAVFGLGTLGLTFMFARKYFASDSLALFSTALLALLPSHVFYSRIGMQESLSTFLVLAGFYFYIGSQKLSWRTFAAGLFWGAAYFSNYRLIMLPLLITVAEVYLAFAAQRCFDVRKWTWVLLVFLGCVFGVGSVKGGENTTVIFAWIFHQANMAGGQRDWVNIFSYPYYLLRLETFLFAGCFFANVYLVVRRQWPALLPFVLVCSQMAVFTFASEKGARYICVVLPFAAMSAAYVINDLWTRNPARYARPVILVLTALMTLMMAQKSFALSRSVSDYRSSALLLRTLDPGAKILSTQNYIQNLYFADTKDVLPCPSRMEALLQYYARGYRYLILCPQAYVSLTESQKRFDPPLRGYLQFLTTHFKPQKTYPHFNEELLERFVLEHNENLGRSIQFLQMSRKHHYGELKIYDLSFVVKPMLEAVSRSEGQTHER